MKVLPFSYCYFSFKSGADKHELRVWVTPSLCLEWKLYINDGEAGRILDGKTNILMPEELDKALSYTNVTSVYVDLLSRFAQ